MAADFPYARTLIVVRSQRTIKKTGATSTESRYYLCSAQAQQYTPAGWHQLIRGHWAGVEIRNHWRRDVLMGEDRSRSRKANLLANLALIRNALLYGLAQEFHDSSQPQVREALQSNLKRCLALISSL